MRPNILFPLFASISAIKGVGNKTLEAFERLVGGRLIDLLWHFPTSVIDRRNMPKIPEMQAGSVVTVQVEIQQHTQPPPYKKQLPYKIRCYNSSGFLTIVYFHARPDYLKRLFPEGQERVISGKVERFGGEVQITHPDYVDKVENIASVCTVEPIYPLTYALTRKMLHHAIEAALARTPELPEWIEPNFLKKQQWKGWKQSLEAVHHPKAPSDLDPQHPARQRLAYDEFLAHQLSLRLIRTHTANRPGNALAFEGKLAEQFIPQLPFKLTNGQQQALAEISADQKSNIRMMRLLQGDVGSGKTVVSFIAMLNCVEAGMQAAIMAPTEILARQHFKAVEPYAAMLGQRIAFLSGSVKGKERTEILEQLQRGELHMIVGTHALFQEQVKFHRLGLVVIDEQHRFGVDQRMTLAGKGLQADVLLMSATPIPRTLTLTLYGDMECSILKEKPAGRKPIDTRVVPHTRMDDVIAGVERVIKAGNKAYWICPLVEESESSDLTAVEERHAALKKHFGNQVGLMHGRMKGEEREKIMAQFRDGDMHILVATTVVEVGVDVPDATVIIIEHAERFGLSQLHQLRGRVGRSDKPSSCILLYHHLGEIAKKRLTICRESNDGFYIAEEDLRLRGGGEILGTRQSGYEMFRIADPYEHHELLRIAADDAKLILNQDKSLESERGNALRTLLYLFEYERQMQYLKAG